MIDTLTKIQRQYCMSQNKGKDTNPEIFIRKLIFPLGYRYRLHRKNLPGCPDIVFPGKKKVIFVNGCYWHRHTCKKGRSTPATRKKFWQSKFNKTIERDKKNLKLLRKQGWKVLIIWECQTKNAERLTHKLQKFLTA